MSLLDKIPGVAQLRLLGIGAGAVGILSFAIWAGLRWHELQVLRRDNAILVQNNKTLQVNTDILRKDYLTCNDANMKNTETIDSLIKERDDAQKAIESLSNAQKSNTATISTLQSKLSELKKNAANNGPLAPVLRETIRGIQNTGANP